MRIVQTANELIGTMTWEATSCVDQDGTQTGHMLKAADAVRFDAIGRDSVMNCWEAVAYIGYRSLANPGIRSLFRLTIALVLKMGIDTDYEEFLLDDVLQRKRTIRVPNYEGLSLIPAGSVVFFMGDAHVALKVESGNTNLVSLWTNSEGFQMRNHLQLADMHVLLRYVVSDDKITAAALTAGLKLGREYFPRLSEQRISASYEALKVASKGEDRSEKIKKAVYQAKIDTGITDFRKHHKFVDFVPDPFQQETLVEQLCIGWWKKLMRVYGMTSFGTYVSELNKIAGNTEVIDPMLSRLLTAG